MGDKNVLKLVCGLPGNHHASSTAAAPSSASAQCTRSSGSSRTSTAYTVVASHTVIEMATAKPKRGSGCSHIMTKARACNNHAPSAKPRRGPTPMRAWPSASPAYAKAASHDTLVCNTPVTTIMLAV